jgi:hypothetical protein
MLNFIPWWGWLLIAVSCWFFQLFASAFTYKAHSEQNTGPAWIIRGALIAGMVLSLAIAVIRFTKWAWGG